MRFERKPLGNVHCYCDVYVLRPGLYRPGLYDRFRRARRSFRRLSGSRAPVIHMTPIASAERKSKPVAAVASERNDLEKKSNDFQRERKTEIRYRSLF